MSYCFVVPLPGRMVRYKLIIQLVLWIGASGPAVSGYADLKRMCCVAQRIWILVGGHRVEVTHRSKDDRFILERLWRSPNVLLLVQKTCQLLTTRCFVCGTVVSIALPRSHWWVGGRGTIAKSILSVFHVLCATRNHITWQRGNAKNFSFVNRRVLLFTGPVRTGNGGIWTTYSVNHTDWQMWGV